MNQQNLWAPWRMAYLNELERREQNLRDQNQNPPAGPDNFLAEYWAAPERDEAQHVLYRNADGMVLLNRYPYAAGHLLIALGEARPRLLDYTSPQRAAFWKLIELAMQLAHQTLQPQGINLGINEGRAAGAGVPGHLHAHIVPRWGGDTNFITVVGQVRVMPAALETMATRYRTTIASLDQTAIP